MTRVSNRVSHSDLLLIAAEDVPADEVGRFTIEELAVRAWKRWPHIFGMVGFEKLYPDLNKVKATIYHPGRSIKQMEARGMTPMRKIPDQPETWVLTEAGVQYAQRMKEKLKNLKSRAV